MRRNPAGSNALFATRSPYAAMACGPSMVSFKTSSTRGASSPWLSAIVRLAEDLEQRGHDEVGRDLHHVRMLHLLAQAVHLATEHVEERHAAVQVLLPPRGKYDKLTTLRASGRPMTAAAT